MNLPYPNSPSVPESVPASIDFSPILQHSMQLREGDLNTEPEHFRKVILDLANRLAETANASSAAAIANQKLRQETLLCAEQTKGLAKLVTDLNSVMTEDVIPTMHQDIRGTLRYMADEILAVLKGVEQSTTTKQLEEKIAISFQRNRQLKSEIDSQSRQLALYKDQEIAIRDAREERNTARHREDAATNECNRLKATLAERDTEIKQLKQNTSGKKLTEAIMRANRSWYRSAGAQFMGEEPLA